MDITELGAIRELVGGLAVIGLLIFVETRIHSPTRALRAAAIREAGHTGVQHAAALVARSQEDRRHD